jgi:hypothetical protein
LKHAARYLARGIKTRTLGAVERLGVRTDEIVRSIIGERALQSEHTKRGIRVIQAGFGSGFEVVRGLLSIRKAPKEKVEEMTSLINGNVVGVFGDTITNAKRGVRVGI